MIPAPPPGAVRFNPPPAWRAPEGFDPRRGHLPDPAWPGVEANWQFWVPDAGAGRDRPVLPSATLPREVSDPNEHRRLVLILAAGFVVLIGLIAWGVVASDEETDPPAIGSCWAGEGEWLNEVPCTSPTAVYIVEDRVTTPDECPSTSMDYFDLGGAISCLRQLS